MIHELFSGWKKLRVFGCEREREREEKKKSGNKLREARERRENQT